MSQSFRAVLSFVSLSLAVFALAFTGNAQTNAVNAGNLPPTPGSGHDYLQRLQETVDPASGQVSLRLGVPVPPGRGLTLPFSFAYDSNSVNYAGQSTLVNQPPYSGMFFRNTSPIQSGGWTYTIPAITLNMMTRMIANSQGHLIPCQQFTGFTFQDPSGGAHDLKLGYIPQTSPCNVATVYASGGDDFVTATETANGPGLLHEQDGTVYSFPSPTGYYTLPSGGQYYLKIASWVEDTNGNKVTMSAPAIQPNSYLQSYSVTDSTGRTALSLSGFGTSGNTVTVSGLGQPYTLTWGNVSTSGFSVRSTPPDSSWDVSGCGGIGTVGASSPHEITKIALPNGQSYNLTYDSTYGELAKITYPSGGYVSYSWGMNTQSAFVRYQGCGYIYDKPALLHRYVSFDGSTIALQQDFQYTTTWRTGTQDWMWATKQTIVTTTVKTPDGQNSVYTTTYTYTPYSPSPFTNIPPGYDQGAGMGSNTITNGDSDTQIPVEQTVVYKGPGGTTLKTVTKSWADQFRLTSEQTTLDNNQVAQVAYTYGTGMQLIEKDEYDFGSGTRGALLRKTVTNYQAFSATPLYPSAPSIFNKPCQKIVYDGSGNRVAETDYLYDNQTTLCGTAGTPVVTSVSNLSGHDETNYSASSTAPRGNVTKRTDWLSTPGGTSPSQTYTYDETGQKLTTTDPLQNITTYYYTDSYTDSTPPNQTNAYITKIVYPPTANSDHTVSFSYAYSDGQMTVSKDENGNTTYFYYNDNLRRLTETDYPDTGKTTYSYNDSPYNPATPSPSVTTSKLMSGTSNWLTEVDAMDGLGHIIRNELTSDPQNTDYTDITYDGLGRKYTVSNPYRTTSDTTYGITKYGYDALNRVLSFTNPDNSSRSVTYTGRATQTTDEGNGSIAVQRISQVDGLGRVTALCEVSVSGSALLGSGGTPVACGLDISANGFLTSYSYDTLENLTNVSQASFRKRTFTHDSLSRLVCVGIPEVSSSACPNPDNGQYTSGTIRYTYDGNGNVVSRVAPAPDQTNYSNTVTTTYQYDQLNRKSSVTYNPNTTPSATLQYDQSTVGGFSPQNRKGHLTYESSAGGTATTIFSYDAMGRTVNEWQCTPVNCGTGSFALAYSYDLSGDLLTSTDGFGHTITNAYNLAGRLTGVTSSLSDANHPPTLVTIGNNYNAPGFPTSLTLGNNVAETFIYNNRLKLTSHTAGSVYTFSVGYAPDANVTSGNDSVNGNWTYTYDDFNRLLTSNKNSGQQTFSYDYDRFSNRWHQNAPQGGPAPQLSFSGDNNHMDSFSYDAAGNVLNDGNHNYAYDAENRITQVDGGSSATYTYDASSRRVRKATSSGTTDYVYDIEGNEFAEANGSGSWIRGEVYASGRHLATYWNGTTYFIHSDWLGTERGRSDINGHSYETCTSLPFGDGQACAGSDVSPLHFTGQERDTESGLDNFKLRYDSSSLGRFMSVDPISMTAAAVPDPQSWNAYSYVRNNPVNLVDPTGAVWCSDNLKSCITDTQYEALKQAKNDVWMLYTKHIIDDRALGLTEAEAQWLANQLMAGHYEAYRIFLMHKIEGITDESGDILAGVAGAKATEFALSRALGWLGDVFGWGEKTAYQLGIEGEAAVNEAYDIGEKTAIEINGRTRIPDGLTSDAIAEVKNTKYQALTRQLRDDIDFARQTGRRVYLFTRPDTRLSQPLADAISNGSIIRMDIPQ